MDMTQANMTTFSSMGDFFKERMVTTDIVCPTHGCNLVSAFDREPICMECIKIEKDKTFSIVTYTYRF